MKKASIIVCNDGYVAKAIVSLKVFKSKNNDYDLFILGTVFSKESYSLAKEYGVKIIEKNLKNDFNNLHKRPYGNQYPIECYYRFYVTVALKNYDYVVVIEPDIYTNKSIDINLNEIKYIGGSFHHTKKINSYGPIMNDIPKWKAHTNIKFDLNQFRVLGGISIFNVKNLNKIDFYKKVVYLYKKSWHLNAPRCGDDSLMVLYQAIHPNHFKLYPNHFHTIEETNIQKIPQITFFHSMGRFIKYWKTQKPFGEINKYFNEKFIEFLYNNFPRRYIKKYYKDIYINTQNVKIDFFYYNQTPNFGDMLVPYILNKITNKDNYQFDFNENQKPKILSIGSIMRIANKNTIICGSGIRDLNQPLQYTNALFVRGPHTRNALLKIGVYTPHVYGDMGLLMPDFYKPKFTKKYKIGIVPHYVDYPKAKQLYGNNPLIHIIDVRNPNIEHTINQIANCEKILSSSLHGLIICDAYNIPNKWIKFSNDIKGDDTKFQDYFLSVSRVDRTPIINFNVKHLLNYLFVQIKPVQINFKKNELKKLVFYNKKGLKPYIKYLFAKLQKQ